ncbi:peptidyl-tRNA hydrolase [Vibrio splendidus]|nr:peptidyl-tRNA hydrolase [Vibrio splendidus]MCC4880694.1 hypothetical protein [Vibrio splendidus]
MLKVYVRKDLKMNRGKTIAQISHVAMKYVLSALSVENGIITGEKSVLEKLRLIASDVENYVDIVMINSEEEAQQALNSYDGYATSIIDNGHTYFKGQKTLTCIAVDADRRIPVLREPEYGIDDRDVKQVLLFNSGLEMQKQEQYSVAIAIAMNTILERMVDDSLDLNKEENLFLQQWLRGCFKKVTLKTKLNETMQSVRNEAESRGMTVISHSVNGNMAAVAIGAAPTHMFAGLTDTLTLY